MKKGCAVCLLLTFFIVSCSDSVAPKLIERPIPLSDKDKFKGVSLTFKPEADLLFIIDNSGSMSEYQANLSRNVEHFTKGIMSNPLIDFHIGVTTSDGDSEPDLSGKLWAYEPNTPLWVDRWTPDREKVLQRNMLPGTSGDWNELFFQPLKDALSEPVLSGHNKGFYRENAILAVVFITDAEAVSNITVDEMWEFLLELKGYDVNKIVAYAAIRPLNAKNCRSSGEEDPVKIIDFLTNKIIKTDPFKSNYFSICKKDFGEKLAEMGDDLVKRVDMFVPLKRVPVPDTIKVTYGNQIIPNVSEIGGQTKKGWSYDRDRVGISFGTQLDIVDDPNAELAINYIPADIH